MENNGLGKAKGFEDRGSKMEDSGFVKGKGFEDRASKMEDSESNRERSDPPSSILDSQHTPSLPDAKTKLVGLLGYPVAHSLSPLIHNTAFRAQGLDWIYVALPVAPADVAEAVAGLKALGFVGSNVTVPHKQAVLPLMDVLSPEAQAVDRKSVV